MTKKIISILLALALSASLCACGNTDTNDATDDENMGTVSAEEAEEYYDLAKAHLAEYLEKDYLFVNGEGWFYEHDASEYLYNELEALGDYADSAQILAQFVTNDDGKHIYLPRAYQTAMTYLEEYLTSNGFTGESIGHLYGDAALTYLYNEFKTLGDYEDSAKIFAQFITRDDGKMIYIPMAYKAAIEDLEEYLENGYIYVDSRFVIEQAALEYLYKEFESFGDYEDSAEILARFTVLPDMLTSITNTRADNLGNAEEYTYKSYEYNKKGILRDDSILEFLGLANWTYDFQYEYDKHDNLVAVKLVDYEGILAIVTPEYDESGKIVKAIIQTNTDTYTSTWTYDEQDHLITAEKYVFTPIGGRYLSSYTYTYDANGHLTKEQYFYNDGYDNECTITYSYYENGDLKEKDVKDYKSVSNFTSVYTCAYEYTYDVNGYLVMKKENNTIVNRYYESQTSTQFLYTNDENGRPVSAELIETVDGKNSYASQILTYNYETLYFYDAE